MRTRRLFVLTLVVLCLHAIGWRIAGGGAPRFEAARRGVRTLASVSVPPGARVPFTLVAPGPKAPAAPRPMPVRAHLPVPPPAQAAPRASPGAGR